MGIQPGPSTLLETGVVKPHYKNISRARRKMFRRLEWGAVRGYAPWHVDTHDAETVKAGLQHRLCRTTPVPCYNVLREFKEFVSKYVAKLPKVRVLEFEEWLEGTTYNDERKRQLRQAHDDLRGGVPTQRQCQHIDTFIKSESYTEPKMARLINSRSDAFKVFSGPAFKAVESVVYDIPEFIKHVPVAERPARVLALKQAGRHYYQTDFTAFESHFTPEVMEVCEFELYKHCLADWAHLPVLLRTLSGKNKLRTREGFSCEVIGRRMSGEMCTSLGNGFSNLMLAKFLAFQQGHDLYGFVEGDDGLFSTRAVLTAAQYANLGFTIKIEEVADPCHASFCGMIFAESGEIIKDPRKFLQNFGWTMSFINAGKEIMNQLLKAKAISAIYEAPQCPIVGVLARQALIRVSKYHPRFINDHHHEQVPHDFKVTAFSPTPSTRALFAQIYGVSVSNQLAIEQAIRDGNMDKVSSLLPPSAEIQDFASKYVIVT